MATVPKQKPGKSVQEVETPEVFLGAVRRRLGIAAFSIDLAADATNAKAEQYYDPAIDALKQPWFPYCTRPSSWAWCNPPYANIAPWVEKAYREMSAGARIAMLLPAGVGSNWYRDWVHGKAPVLALNGRITFVGHPTPYPKDLILILWDEYGLARHPTFDVWTWNGA